MAARAYRDPVGDTATKAADRSYGPPRDEALRLAADAKARGDLAGHERFMAAARRGVR